VCQEYGLIWGPSHNLGAVRPDPSTEPPLPKRQLRHVTGWGNV